MAAAEEDIKKPLFENFPRLEYPLDGARWLRIVHPSYKEKGDNLPALLAGILLRKGIPF